MMVGLAADHGEQTTVMIPEGNRTATCLGVKRGRGRLIGRTKCGMNTKPHSICDCQGRPLYLLVTAGQVATTSAYGRLLAAGQTSNGCLETVDMTPTGSETHCKTRVYAHASPAEYRARKLSYTPLVTSLWNALAGSERDHVWEVERLAARGNLPRQIAPRSSSQPSHSLQPSSIGYES